MISGSPYPLNLIKDIFGLHRDTSLALTENATKIVEKCLDEHFYEDYFRYGYIIRRRYKDRAVIRVIAEEVNRSRAVVNSRIEKALMYLYDDSDLREAFVTDVPLEKPFDRKEAAKRLAEFEEMIKNGSIRIPRRYRRKQG